MKNFARRENGARRWATLLTEVFAPTVLISVLLVMASVNQAGSAGLGAALVALVFVTAIPFTCVYLLAKHGRVTDHHVGNRGQRAPILLGTLASIAVGLSILFRLDAPKELVLMIVGTMVGIVLVLAVNLIWKLSAHAAVGAFFTVASTTLLGPWGLTTVLIPLSVGWSRVVLSAHTRAQVTCGFIVGLLVGFTYVVAHAQLLT